MTHALTSISYALRWISTAGYIALLIRLYTTGALYLNPVFTAYVAGLSLYYCIWDSGTLWSQIVFQPCLLALRVGAAMEAGFAVIEQIGRQEKRWLFSLCCTFGLIGVMIVDLVEFSGRNEVMLTYRLLHQSVNVSIMLALVTGWLYMRIDPPQVRSHAYNHAVIFTALCVAHSGVGFMTNWALANGLFFLASSACIVAWLRFGLFEQMFYPRFKMSHPIS
jgi:hypothetical protein